GLRCQQGLPDMHARCILEGGTKATHQRSPVTLAWGLSCAQPVVDGPKHEAALALAGRLLRAGGGLVRLVAIHDSRSFKRGPRAHAWRRHGLRPLLFTDAAWLTQERRDHRGRHCEICHVEPVSAARPGAAVDTLALLGPGGAGESGYAS
ncbi:unnamed protein product, partial [Prorocentrum cordatum]